LLLPSEPALADRVAVVVIPAHAPQSLRRLRHPLVDAVAAVLLQPRRAGALRVVEVAVFALLRCNWQSRLGKTRQIYLPIE